MKNRKLFFKRFVMGIVIFFMAVFELQMIWGSVYISKTVTKERKNSYASALEIYSSNLEQQLKQIDDFLLQSVMIENDARSILESTTELNQYLAEVRMRDTFDEELSQLKMLSGVMWYGKTANVTKKVIRMRRGQNNASVISKWIAENTEGLLKKVKENAYVDWFVYEVEGSQILVRILNNRETYMIGWLDISQIFQEFEKTLSDVKDYRTAEFASGCPLSCIEAERILSENDEAFDCSSTGFNCIRNIDYAVLSCDGKIFYPSYG